MWCSRWGCGWCGTGVFARIGTPRFLNQQLPLELGLEAAGAVIDAIMESNKGTLSVEDACKLLNEVQSMHWQYDKNRGRNPRACQVRTLDK